MRLAVAIALIWLGLQAVGHPARAVTLRFPATGVETKRLRLHAATDVEAMAPLIRDFQSLQTDVAVEYTEYQTVDLFVQAQEECRAGRSTRAPLR